MRTATTLATASLTLLVTALGAGPAGAVDGTAVGCGDTVETHGHLAEDLVCGEIGLTLLPGSTLDLRGHELSGAGAEAGGLAFSTQDDIAEPPITVRNGRLTGWSRVFADMAVLRADLLDLRVVDNGEVVQASTFVGRVESSRFVGNTLAIGGFGGDVTIEDSQFVDNVTAVATYPAGGRIRIADSRFRGNERAVDCSEGMVSVVDSVFRDNGGAVTGAWCSHELSGNTFTGNGTAFASTMVSPTFTGINDRLEDNRFVGNDVAADLGVGAALRDNEFRRNGTAVTSTTAGSALEVERIVLERNLLVRNGDAIMIDTTAELGANVALRNTGYGIWAPLARDLGGNVARRNGTEPQCTGVVCSRS